ncbi:unnamed protein product [Schistocephalus solidus]|uniref:Integrase catalytic domain-containing protein n=1 Tax=Schistocephalus solidus TaxID=70667 RepID=A0A183TLZ9_SCHSO|nr:unnamed protein product [Schistocephalus solidus]
MTTGFPGECIGLDIIRPLPISVRGHAYILVIIDYFTKGTEAISLLRQDAASVANAINRTWISRWGSPYRFIQTARGPFAVLDALAPTSFHLRDAIRAEKLPFTAHFSKLKPYHGHLPVCTADSLPILPTDQCPR